MAALCIPSKRIRIPTFVGNNILPLHNTDRRYGDYQWKPTAQYHFIIIWEWELASFAAEQKTILQLRSAEILLNCAMWCTCNSFCDLSANCEYVTRGDRRTTHSHTIPINFKFSYHICTTNHMALYQRSVPKAPQNGKTEFQILKESHRYVSNLDPRTKVDPSASWQDSCVKITTEICHGMIV